MSESSMVWTKDGDLVSLDEWRTSPRPEQWALVACDGLGSDYMERPRFAFHVPPWRDGQYRRGKHQRDPQTWASADGGLHAYGLPSSSENSGEARDIRKRYTPQLDVDTTGIIWLSLPWEARPDKNKTHARRDRVVLVDLGQCNPDRLRDTGQWEGNVVHAGPISADALVAPEDWPAQLDELRHA